MSTGATGSPLSEIAKVDDRKEKKRLWDIILTATPVALTLLATALASFSNKEMTKAQYFRATAAQNQSKAGDQWAFFQTKHVLTVLQLQRADRGAFDEAQARALSLRLPVALKRLDDEAKELLPKLDGELAELKPSLQQLREVLDKTVIEITATQKEIAQFLDNPEIKKELIHLTHDLLPLPKDADPKVVPRKVVREVVKAVEEKNGVTSFKKGTHEINPFIEKGLEAIETHKPRVEYEADVLAIKGDVLRQAIEAAEAESKLYDDASRTATRAFDDLAKLISKQKEIFRPVGRAALRLRDAIDALPRTMAKNGSSPRVDLLDLALSVERLDQSCRNLSESLSTARADFDARRLDREARFNQEIAGLYEVDVYREGFMADECMVRKDIYMYGMLAAQAGVMIATFGLAVRLRGVLWALAALAGLTAIFMFGMGLGVLTYIGLHG